MLSRRFPLPTRQIPIELYLSGLHVIPVVTARRSPRWPPHHLILVAVGDRAGTEVSPMPRRRTPTQSSPITSQATETHCPAENSVEHLAVAPLHRVPSSLCTTDASVAPKRGTVA
jgi:hypothetical protein